MENVAVVMATAGYERRKIIFIKKKWRENKIFKKVFKSYNTYIAPSSFALLLLEEDLWSGNVLTDFS